MPSATVRKTHSGPGGASLARKHPGELFLLPVGAESQLPDQLLQERSDLGERQTIINGALVLGRLRHGGIGRLMRVLDDGGSSGLLHGLQSHGAIAEQAG